MRRAIVFAALFGILGSMPGEPALAQSNADRQVSREREMLRRLQDLTRQSAQEKAALTAEIDALQKKLKAAEQGAGRSARKSRDTEKVLAAEAAEKSRVITEKAAVEAQLREVQQSLDEARLRLDGAAEELRAKGAALENAARLQGEMGNEIASARNTITQREREIGVCESKNMSLYGYTVELLDRYQGKGVWEVLKQQEPFTGIKGVELENLLEEYRDKVDEQQIISGRSRPGQR